MALLSKSVVGTWISRERSREHYNLLRFDIPVILHRAIGGSKVPLSEKNPQ